MRFIKLFAQNIRAPEESEGDIETALHEALANSVIHGNHEDPHKRVYISCRCSMDGEITIIVRDEGPGFDSRALPDPTDTKNRLLRQGRGIYLMRALMDEVSFEDNGRLVRMRKRLAVA
jgi:serine/threonine-protein kinase RsbW